MSGTKRRAVVQGYPRRRGGAQADNPYPTVASATKAIETLAAPPQPELLPVLETPRPAPEITVQPKDMGPPGSRGAVYDSADEAARAILERINLWSVLENREYLSEIYRDKNGKYGYTTAIPTGAEGVKNFRVAPPPGSFAGLAHTHGAYSDREHRRVGRSEDAFNSDDFSTGDYDYMRRNPYGAEAYYLGTPSGRFYRYSRKGGRKPF
jgi:hypothetical protein